MYSDFCFGYNKSRYVFTYTYVCLCISIDIYCNIIYVYMYLIFFIGYYKYSLVCKKKRENLKFNENVYVGRLGECGEWKWSYCHLIESETILI